MLKSSRVATFFALLVCFSVISIFGPGSALARDWVVPDQAPTIQSAMDSCVTGDVVVIQAGTYDDCTHLSNGALHIAVLPSGVSMRGATGDPADVILDAGYLGRCIEIRDNTVDFSIEDITMRRGRAFSPLGKGGAVFAMFANPTFRNCVFDSNYADFGGGAISAGYGDSLIVENCIFNGSETDGIGGAIQVSNTRTRVTSCTINGTRGAAIHYSNEELILERSIIAFGDAEALVQNTGTDPDPEISCCDIFGNNEDYSEFFASDLGQSGNISIDPLFCNPIFGDLHLSAVSPCATENSGDCGLIGNLDVGCGTGAATYVIYPDGSGGWPTIQAAINIAVVGDTIALADGVFTGDGNRDLDFLGKAITVQGLSGDPDLAIIDCQGTTVENHRGFIFQTNEIVTSVLKNLSITNGNVDDTGGAILCMSSPMIENCRIYQNHADYGGGIYCDHGSPTITNCEIYQNEGRAKGGGMGLFASEAQINYSLFTANWGYMGAAIFLPDSSSVQVYGCTITNNANSLDKATIGLDGNSSLTISNTIVAFGPHYAFGEYAQGTVDISGCNVFGHGSGDYAGPISGDNGTSGNISADPLYCDGGTGDFSLRGDSPCSEHSAPNGVQIGNYPVGCAAPSIFSDMSASIPANNGLSSGVNLVDWNNDGHLDVLVVGEEAANEAYDGQGGWVFSAHGSDFATFSSGAVSAAFADYDADGDLDLYLSTHGIINFLGENVQGVFSIVPADSLEQVSAAGSSSWCDHNNDGHLDMFIAATDSGSLLMTSDGEGSYTNSTTGSMAEVGNCIESAWADYDNDGDQDLYVVQDGMANMLIKNDEEFIAVDDAALQHAGAGRGASWGDFDNDGDLDLYLAVDGGPNQLITNIDAEDFATVQSGPLADDGPGRSGIWGDWDNDGDLDLFLTNFGEGDHLLRNSNGTFYDTQDSVFANPDSSEGAAFGDMDNDGDLDLVVAVRGGSTRLYRNNTVNGNHWLKLDLRSLHGMVGSVGARVYISTGVDTIQIREVAAGGGWHSSDDMVVHFGLGAETVIDSLSVTWPGGYPLSLTNVDVDQLLVLVEEEEETLSAVPENLALRSFQLRPAYPNPFNPSTTIRYSVPKNDKATVRIYDVAGRLVKILVDEPHTAGEHEVVWRGRDRSGRTVAAGVYYVRLKTGRFTTARPVTLIK